MAFIRKAANLMKWVVLGICLMLVLCFISAPEMSQAGEGYKTAQTVSQAVTSDIVSARRSYVLNTNSQKFHKPSCPSVKKMAERNKAEIIASREQIMARNYVPCKKCNP